MNWLLLWQQILPALLLLPIILISNRVDSEPVLKLVRDVMGLSSLSSASQRFTIIIDAGSSGSRLYIFQWNGHHPDSELNIGMNVSLRVNSKGRTLEKVKPGLSTVGLRDASELIKYMEKLIDVARSSIPSHQHSQTPFYIRATAGMRLLTDQQQQMIWSRVRTILKERSPFKFQDNYASTISGEQEGAYAWLTINYLLGKLNTTRDSTPTVGMVDMGGASAQVAYEVGPRSSGSGKSIRDLHVRQRGGDWKLYRIFVVSLLGYGANEMRHCYENVLSVNGKLLGTVGNIRQYEDPCLLPGQVSDPIFNRSSSCSFGKQFVGTGNSQQCFEAIRPLLLDQQQCVQKASSDPLSANNLPDMKSSDQSMLYGLSEFYYQLKSYLKKMENKYEAAKVDQELAKICDKQWNDYSSEMKQRGMKEAHYKFTCFKANYVLVLLHEGIKFPRASNNLRVIDQINGYEVQWPLGALFKEIGVVRFDSRYATASTGLIAGVTCLALLTLIGALAGFAYCRTRLQGGSRRRSRASVA